MGEVINMKTKGTVTPQSTQKPLTVREVVAATIQELFNSEIFEEAITNVIKKHDVSKAEESIVRHEVSELVKELATLKNVEPQNIYGILRKRFRISQTAADYHQLLERKEMLIDLIEEEKAKK